LRPPPVSVRADNLAIYRDEPLNHITLRRGAVRLRSRPGRLNHINC